MESNQTETRKPAPTTQESAPPPARKRYATPTLIVHGTLEQITGGPNVAFDDGINGNSVS